MDELKYTIAEASEMLGGVSYRTLHYYEAKLGINVARDGSGNRVYSDRDIDVFDKIIALKKKGMSLDGIKALFVENGLIEPEEDHHIVVVDEKALEMKEYLISEIRSAVSLQMKEELLETNSKLEQSLQEISDLKNLIQAMTSQSEDHFSSIDKKISQWREEHSQEKKSWLKRMIGK